MTPNPHQLTATADNFMQDVVEASARVPVLVDFWAPWCGPCRQLGPILDRLAEEYAGRFVLAKVNTDEQQALAGQMGIRSLPTVALFKDRTIVDHFLGLVPESQIRALLDRHVGPAAATAESPLDRARALIAAGQLDAAHAILSASLADGPNDVELKAALAETMALQGEVDAAQTLLTDLKSREPTHKAVKRLAAVLAFNDVVRQNPDVRKLETLKAAQPDDPGVGHALAVHRLLNDQPEAALQFWLELLRTNRRYGDDLARKSLLMSFELLGESMPLVAQTRREMARLLF